MSQTVDNRVVTFKIIEHVPNEGGFRLTLFRQAVTMKVMPGVGTLPSKDTERYYMQWKTYTGATEVTLNMSQYDKSRSDYIRKDGLPGKSMWLYPKFDAPEDLSVPDTSPAEDNLLPSDSPEVA